MKIEAYSPEEYIDKLPDERKQAMTKLRQIILTIYQRKLRRQ